jgi:hypothetical protein
MLLPGIIASTVRTNEIFNVTIIGLTDEEARIGDHASIGYTTDAVSETVKWSNNSDPAAPATYGTGASPTDFTTGDEGSLWLHVTDGGETVSRSAPIRYAPGAASSIADGQTATVDDTVLNIPATASGANLTFTYSLLNAPAGMTTNPSTGGIGGTVTEVFNGTVTLRATDQYVRTLDDTFTFTSSLRTTATAANGLSDQNWTVDDDSVNLSLVSDFTTNGNTLTYVITGLPTGLVDDGDGTISGTPTVNGQSGTITITATDEYSRQVSSAFSYTTAYRTQATAGTALDLSFVQGEEITPVDLAQNFTENGNTLTYSLVDTPPTGLTAVTQTLSGTPSSETADASYTFQGVDEYARVTSVEHTIEITEAPTTFITLDPANTTYTPGGSENGPTLDVENVVIENTTGPYDVFIVTHQADVTFDAAEIIAGTDVNILDAVSFQDADGAVTGQELTLTEDMTAGYLSLVIRDSSDPEVVSNVIRLTDVDVDATAATLSSPVATQTGVTTADWSITSNEASGVVYAGVRPTASAALTSAQLIAGSGGAGVAWSTDTTMTADANNGGTFTGLTAETAYQVDYVAVDDWGNVGSVVSSAEFTTAAAPVLSFSYIGTATDLDAQASYTFTDADVTGLDFTAGGKFLVHRHTAPGYKLELPGTGGSNRCHDRRRRRQWRQPTVGRLPDAAFHDFRNRDGMGRDGVRWGDRTSRGYGPDGGRLVRCRHHGLPDRRLCHTRCRDNIGTRLTEPP